MLFGKDVMWVFFCGWDITKSLTAGFSGAGYQKVASEVEAFQILEEKFIECIPKGD